MESRANEQAAQLPLETNPRAFRNRTPFAVAREPVVDDDMLVCAMTATPTQSRTSFRASLGTIMDARKMGKNLFPVHRNATISPSAASKRFSTARLSPVAYLQGMTSRLNR